MSSFAYLTTTGGQADATIDFDGGETLADASYRLPLLWIALLEDGAELREQDESLAYVTSAAAALERLTQRVGRLATLLPQAPMALWVAYFVELVREDAAELLVVDVTEVDAMDEPGLLAAQVRRGTRWLDGHDETEGPAGLLALCGLDADASLPEPSDDLDETCSKAEWERVMSLIGAPNE